MRLTLVNGSYQTIDGRYFIFIFTDSRSKFSKKKKKKKTLGVFNFGRLTQRVIIHFPYIIYAYNNE
jgi:hypothetical protein